MFLKFENFEGFFKYFSGCKNYKYSKVCSIGRFMRRWEQKYGKSAFEICHSRYFKIIRTLAIVWFKYFHNNLDFFIFYMPFSHNKCVRVLLWAAKISNLNIFL